MAMIDIICKNCGKKYKIVSLPMFCKKCGHRLRTATTQKPKIIKTHAPRGKICKKCGYFNTAIRVTNNRTCKKCNEPISFDEKKNVETRKKPEKLLVIDLDAESKELEGV